MEEGRDVCLMVDPSLLMKIEDGTPTDIRQCTAHGARNTVIDPDDRSCRFRVTRDIRHIQLAHAFSSFRRALL